MSHLTLSTSIYDSKSRLGFSNSTRRLFTSDRMQSDVFTVGIDEYELDLSGVGPAGIIVLLNCNPASPSPVCLLFGYESCRYHAMLRPQDSLTIPLLPTTTKFYLRAYPASLAVGPEFVADPTSEYLESPVAHGLSIGDTVRFFSGGTMPGGVVELQEYRVNDVDGTTKIALTSDVHIPLDLTTEGTGIHKISGNGPTFTVNTATDVISFASAPILYVGSSVEFETTGVLPGGLSTAGSYKILEKISSTEFRLESEDFYNLDITSAGDGHLGSFIGEGAASDCLFSYMYHVE